ncbi:DMT family transporter [Tropicimonas sp. IMCC6043]|uniref:DMT family transporter n=1 Tax=Tropicimonas sp. IMCC6043 TaxID=2510645 RepID=UPI0013ECAD61|nr:DMT family transporter [Tropicimonas sp. IMCC6043]
MTLAYWSILVALGSVFGASFGFNEILLSAYGPLTVSAVRVGLGAIGCWAWVAATGRRVRLADASLIAIGTFGIFQYAVPFALLPVAQQHITSSSAGIANAMTPVAVVLISHLWPGGEQATLSKMAGVGLGVIGMMVLTTQGSTAGISERPWLLVAALAPVCYGIALNLVRKLRGLDPVVMTACAMTGGAFAILPIALVSEGIPQMPGWQLASAFAVIGFGLTSAAFLIMYSILPKVGATNLSLVTLVAPVSATLIGAGFFGEHIGDGHLTGMALILTGLIAIDGRICRALASRLSGKSVRADP